MMFEASSKGGKGKQSCHTSTALWYAVDKLLIAHLVPTPFPRRAGSYVAQEKEEGQLLFGPLPSER